MPTLTTHLLEMRDLLLTAQVVLLACAPTTS